MCLLPHKVALPNRRATTNLSQVWQESIEKRAEKRNPTYRRGRLAFSFLALPIQGWEIIACDLQNCGVLPLKPRNVWPCV